MKIQWTSRQGDGGVLWVAEFLRNANTTGYRVHVWDDTYDGRSSVQVWVDRQRGYSEELLVMFSCDDVDYGKEWLAELLAGLAALQRSEHDAVWGLLGVSDEPDAALPAALAAAGV